MLVAVVLAAALGAKWGEAGSRSFLYALIAGFAVAIPGGWWLSRSIQRPLASLFDFAEAAAAGDLGRRVSGSWRSELGSLAEALNRMAERLEAGVRSNEDAKARLEAVIASMEEGVLAIDREERVVLANPRLRVLLGSPADPEGRPLFEVARHAAVLHALKGAREDRRPSVVEFETDSFPRRRLRVHASAFPAAGPNLGVLAVFRDVTEVRRLETIRRDFVANASHELKTPLAVIRGFAERLSERSLGDAAADRSIRTILANVNRLGSLVEDLLELSRIESSALYLKPEELDLALWLPDWLAELEPRFQEAKLEASVEAEGHTRLRVDVKALEHVLGNLIDNAIHYTDPEGSIRISARGQGGRVVITIADTGIGISPKDQPRIFERFYRVDPARSRALGGTGLGLSIVKHLVDAMGGEVRVESHPGRGSTFSISLPADGSSPRT